MVQYSCQSPSEGKNKHFLKNYKDLEHSILRGIAPPSYAKTELNSFIFILLQEVWREKKDYFFPFLCFIGPLLWSVLTLWSKIFVTNAVFSNSSWSSMKLADQGLAVWKRKYHVSPGISEGELLEMGPVIGSFLCDVNVPKQIKGTN